MNALVARACQRRVVRDERGSTVPLILGFFLIALMFCGAAIMASDAFTRQRDLQSICDAAASTAANSVDFAAVRGALADQTVLPLAQVQDAVDSYLARDAGREGVQAIASSSPGGDAVTVQCSRTAKLALGGLFGAGSPTVQRASSTARSTLG